MLRRLVAERANSAREGVQLVSRLVERFGYIGSGRTYVIADPSEAWLVAVVRGRRWVAQRVPDDAVVILPNVYIIGQIDLRNTDNFLASPDLVQYAVERGWYDAESGEPFRFDRAYQPAERIAAPDRRQWLGQCIVTGQEAPYPPPQPMPFAVKPARKLTTQGVIGLLRSRAGGVSLFHDKTQEAAVFQLRPHMPPEVGCVYWRTTGRPDTGVLTAWYVGITETPRCYYPPADLRKQLTLEPHFAPPEGTFEPDRQLAWWKFAALQQSVDADGEQRFEPIRKVWDAMEARLYAEQAAVDAKALDLWRTDPVAARAYLTDYCARRALDACREADALAGSD
jgi:dipeptidase